MDDLVRKDIIATDMGNRRLEGQRQFEQLFKIWPDYRVIQCVQCQYAVMPTQIEGHLSSKKHRRSVPNGTRKAIDGFVRTQVNSVAWEAEDVTYPPSDSAPINGFPIFENGLRCVSVDLLDRECGHVCRTVGSMQEHCKTVHGCENGQRRGGDTRKKSRQTPNRLWEEGQAVQQFFVQGSWKRYFAIKPPDPVPQAPASQNTWKERVHATMQAKSAAEAEERAAHRNTIRDDDSRFVTNTFLKALNCATILHGQDREQMIMAKTPIEASSRHQSRQTRPRYEDEHLPDSDFGLERACAGTKRLIRRSLQCCKQHIVGRAALFLINQKHSGGTGPEKKFESNHSVKTVRKYSEWWVMILCFLWRTQHREIRPQYVLTEAQTDALLFLKRLCRNQVSEDTPTDTQQEGIAKQIEHACMAFWLAMLDHDIGDSEHSNGIISALAVLAIDERNKGWKPATIYTPILSAIITISRSMVVYKAYDSRNATVKRLMRAELMSEAKARQVAPSIFDRVQEMSNKFMMLADKDHKPTPMDWMLHIRTLGMRIRYTTNAPGTVEWQGNEITIGQASFRLADLRSTVQGLYNSTRIQLFQKVVMLDVDDHGRPRSGSGSQNTTTLPELNMDDIKDNPSDTWSDKFNFLEYAINKWSVDGKNWLLDRVMEDDKLIKQFVRTADVSPASEDDSNTAIPWNEAGISKYFKAVEKFKEQLFVLVHLTAGAPARGTESVTVAYENGVDDRGYRGVFVDNGLVSFVTSYNKTGVKVIHRYVPREVSELVVYYLWLVQPFVRALQKMVFDQKEYRAFIWEPKPEEQWRDQEDEDWDEIEAEEERADAELHTDEASDDRDHDIDNPDHDTDSDDDSEGFVEEGESAEDDTPRKPAFTPSNPDGVYSTDRCRRLLQEVTRHGMGARIGLAAWREVYPAIHRQLAEDDSIRQTLDTAFGSSKEKRKDQAAQAEEANAEEAVRANQAGHSLGIEDSMYGRMTRESPWITMREKDAFRKVSIDWHRIVGFQPVQTEGRNTVKSAAHIEQQAEADKFQRWRAFRQADMLDAFKRMMGPDAEFRGVQFAILQALKQGHKNVLGIMPTGGGKSLTFMLPARCSPGGVTIVVVPLTALEGDMVRRCKESDIKCAVWDAARPPEWANIVFVTPEAAVGQAFKRFMQQMKSTGQLDRLVIDECHVVLDSSRKTAETDEWRPEILELYKTVEQSVQTLFLTATLPPGNELGFYDKMGINKHEIVKFRDSTTRKEIKYQVVDYEKEEEEEALQRMVDDKKRQYPGKQIIVFCSKIQDGQRYAKTLGCQLFHREMGTEAEKREVVRRLTTGQQDVFVATNALGLGIDAPTIRVVIHMGVRRSMRDFVQESGRAGRDRQWSESIVMRWKRTQSDGSIVRDRMWGVEEAMKAFVEGECCRRVVIDQEMDGNSERMACEVDEQRCDVCAGKPRGTRRRRRRIAVGYGMSEEEDCQSPSGKPSRSTESRFLDSGLGLSSSGYGASTRMWHSSQAEGEEAENPTEDKEQDENIDPNPPSEIQIPRMSNKRQKSQQAEWTAAHPGTTPPRPPVTEVHNSSTVRRHPARGFITPQMRQEAWETAPEFSSSSPVVIPSSPPPVPTPVRNPARQPAPMAVMYAPQAQTEAALRYEFQALQDKAEMVKRGKMQREDDDIRRMERLEEQCDEWSRCCPICKASRVSMTEDNTDHVVGHDWQRCRHKHADNMREIWEMMRVQIRRTKGVSGCPDCFLPQKICKSWEEDQARGYGLYKRCKGQCQYAGLVKAAVAALLTCGSDDEIAEREDWIKERQGIRGYSQGVGWMREKVRVGRYETNEMCWFFNVWG